jgi:hypothetical protein
MPAAQHLNDGVFDTSDVISRLGRREEGDTIPFLDECGSPDEV